MAIPAAQEETDKVRNNIFLNVVQLLTHSRSQIPFLFVCLFLQKWAQTYLTSYLFCEILFPFFCKSASNSLKLARVAFKTNSTLNQSAFVLQPHYSPRLRTNPVLLCSVWKPPHTPPPQFTDETVQHEPLWLKFN